jgi:hypothetical protein
LTNGEIFSKLGGVKRSESGGGHFPARFFASSGPTANRNNQRGKKKRRTI